MEEENQPPIAQTETVVEPAGNKRILLIGAGIILVIVVILASVFLSFAPQRNSPKNQGTANPSPTVSGSSPTKVAEAPLVVAKNFYDWYINHPSPIKSGAYKGRLNTTSDFKEIMGSFVSRGIDPGYDHVFCQMSLLPKDVTLKEPVYDEDQTLALIMFQDPSSGSDLFQMKMEREEQKWLVADVWCP